MTPAATQNCFILKLNYDLTMVYTKTWTTEENTRCEFIKTTRHGDNLYVAGYTTDTGGNKFLTFWHIMNPAYFIHQAN